MSNVDCPWCGGSAIIVVADHDEFSCPGCAIRVELAPEPAGVPVAKAA
jgi:hypothetical protein